MKLNFNFSILIITMYLFFLDNSLALNRSNNSDWFVDVKKKYPSINDTYGISTKEIDEYLVRVDDDIKKSPDDPINFYIKSDLIIIKIGNDYRTRYKTKKYTKNDYQATNKMLSDTLESQKFKKRALLVNENAAINKKLSYDVLSEIAGNSKLPLIKEKAIKARILMTSLDDLEGCPDDPAISDEEYECTPLAQSWAEYIYLEYSEMRNLYSQFLDKSNTDRIKQEFEKRIKSNEKNTEQVEKTIKYYLDEFNKNDKLFWRKLDNGELEGKVVDIKSIPDAYKQVPFYWKNYIVANGLEKYAQWDIKGIDSPDGIKAKQTAPVQQKIQTSVVKSKVKQVKPANPVTPKSLPASDNRSNDRTLYYVLGVLIFLLLMVGIARKWMTKK